jgi:hypothetical protein
MIETWPNQESLLARGEAKHIELKKKILPNDGKKSGRVA